MVRKSRIWEFETKDSTIKPTFGLLKYITFGICKPIVVYEDSDNDKPYIVCYRGYIELCTSVDIAHMKRWLKADYRKLIRFVHRKDIIDVYKQMSPKEPLMMFIHDSNTKTSDNIKWLQDFINTGATFEEIKKEFPVASRIYRNAILTLMNLRVCNNIDSSESESKKE